MSWPSGRLGRIVLVLLLAHLAWGVGRIPSKVWGKRLDEIAEYQRDGAAAFHLDNSHRHGAGIVRRVVAGTPPDAIVLWTGEWKGALEFVAPLIAPRLLVDAHEVDPHAGTFLGRPLARLERADGNPATIVLVGSGDRVELTFR